MHYLNFVFGTKTCIDEKIATISIRISKVIRNGQVSKNDHRADEVRQENQD